MRSVCAQWAVGGVECVMRMHQAVPGGGIVWSARWASARLGYSVCWCTVGCYMNISIQVCVRVVGVIWGRVCVCVWHMSTFPSTCPLRPLVPDPHHLSVLVPAGAPTPDHVDASSRKQHGPH